MKKVGVILVILILFSVSVSAFGLNDFFSLFSGSDPVVTNTQANPIKVYPGQSLNILVSFEDDYGIESAVAYFPYEGGFDKVDMILTAGNEKKGTYSATWVVHHTLNMKWYATKVILINKYGGETAVEVKWQDPTQNHPASQVEPGRFQVGDYTFGGGLLVGSQSDDLFSLGKMVVKTSASNNATFYVGNAGGGWPIGIYSRIWTTTTGNSGYFVGGRGILVEGAVNATELTSDVGFSEHNCSWGMGSLGHTPQCPAGWYVSGIHVEQGGDENADLRCCLP